MWNPLLALWRRGPRFLGMWEGAPDSQICSHLSGVEPRFWDSSAASSGECAVLIGRRYDSFVVCVEFGVALWLCATAVSCATNYLVVRSLASLRAPAPARLLPPRSGGGAAPEWHGKGTCT